MVNKAVCKKVSSMLSLYIDNKVTYQERAFIEDHLSNCDECHKKFIYLRSLIKNLKDSYKQVLELAQKKQKQATFSIREHEKFMENLSPYVDNELDAIECFEFRKYLMKSKTAQKELKNTYLMQKEMRLAFDKTKRKISPVISRNVMNTLRNQNHTNVFDSVIIRELFTPKAAKIAILTGLVFWGGYEIKQFSIPLKPTARQIIKQDKNQPAQKALKETPFKDSVIKKLHD